MATMTFDGIGKTFDDGTVAVANVSFTVNHGEFVVLVGPSGCGKSTLLRMAAGLETLNSGSILVDGTDVTHAEPQDRDIAMVFQNYALYPHMTVYENMAFGLQQRKMPKAEIDRLVQDAAEILDLTRYLHRKPGQLSGGQRQRVAMGRAIVRHPMAFLMDEPLSNLDAKLRVQMRSELKLLNQRLGVTTLYVTHDQVEAMTMADKIVVLNAGNIEQVGSPMELYKAPKNLFVAGFIGSPKMNLVTGTAAAKHNATTIGIRPEHLRVTTTPGEWKATVGVAEHLGSDTFLHVHSELGPLTVRADGEIKVAHGDEIWLTPDAAKLHRFDNDGKAIR